MTLTFERELYRAVMQFKRDHPGALEERTRLRKEREKEANNDYKIHGLPGDRGSY